MKILSVLAGILLLAGNAAALQITTYPTVNFGNITYTSQGNSGSANVTMSPGGVASTSGTGKITAQSGGSAGTAGFKTTNILELLVNVKVNVTTPQTITTAGCGSVTISNITLAGSLNLLTLTIIAGEAQTTVGATLAVSSISNYNCTISGTINNALTYSTLAGDTTPNSPLNLNVSVYVLPPPLTLTHNSGAALNFGQLCTNASATQTLIISSSGGASGSNLTCAAQGYSADAFTVSGPNNVSFSVNSIPSVQLSNGLTGLLTVDNFTTSCSSNCQINENNQYTLRVGGRLTVPATAATGTYTGTYPVTITY